MKQHHQWSNGFPQISPNLIRVFPAKPAEPSTKTLSSSLDPDVIWSISSLCAWNRLAVVKSQSNQFRSCFYNHVNLSFSHAFDLQKFFCRRVWTDSALQRPASLSFFMAAGPGCIKMFNRERVCSATAPWHCYTHHSYLSWTSRRVIESSKNVKGDWSDRIDQSALWIKSPEFRIHSLNYLISSTINVVVICIIFLFR